jgi:hypothetical protein
VRSLRTTRSRAAFVAALALTIGACGHRDWVVLAVNQTSTDVVLRVEYMGGGRDVFLAAGADGVAISLSNPRPPARILALDANTCEVLAADDLPSEPTSVAIVEGGSLSRLEVVAYAKDVGPGDEEPTDPRCAAR